MMPDPGNFCIALRAGPFTRDVILPDDIPASSHQPEVASRAISVFILPDHSRQIPRIDVSQPGLFPDLRRAQKGPYIGIIVIGHLVISMESSHMPGNIP